VIVALKGCVIVVLQGCVIVVLEGCVIVLLRARLRDCVNANTENVYFISSGQTDANLAHLMHGQTDSSLNDHGIKQAQAAGKSLAQVRFDLIFCSDLDRAFATCKHIVDANQVSSGHVKNINKDKRIRERHFGEFENQSLLEYQDKAKENNVEPYYFVPKGSETLEIVRNRAKDFFLVIIDYL
jgi:broad specificity phosphatase PhoE